MAKVSSCVAKVALSRVSVVCLVVLRIEEEGVIITFVVLKPGCTLAGSIDVILKFWLMGMPRIFSKIKFCV